LTRTARSAAPPRAEPDPDARDAHLRRARRRVVLDDLGQWANVGERMLRVCAEPDAAMCPRSHVLDDGVPVAVVVGQGDEDVKRRRL